MKPLHSREEILDLARYHAPTKAVGRIIQTLGATVYGGRSIATGLPGWLVVVTMKHKVWYIEITMDEERYLPHQLIAYPHDRPAGYDKLITREIL